MFQVFLDLLTGFIGCMQVSICRVLLGPQWPSIALAMGPSLCFLCLGAFIGKQTATDHNW